MKKGEFKARAKWFIKEHVGDICIVGGTALVCGVWSTHVYNRGFKDGINIGALGAAMFIDANYEDLDVESKLLELVKKYPDESIKVPNF